MKLKYRLPPGWRKVEGWQSTLDVTPDDILPGSPHRTAVLLHNPTTKAMVFIVPLQLPSFIQALDLIKVIAKGNLAHGNLISPIEETGTGGSFTYVSADGMSAGKVTAKAVAEDRPIFAVTIGMWPTDDEDGPNADFDQIGASLVLV